MKKVGRVRMIPYNHLSRRHRQLLQRTERKIKMAKSVEEIEKHKKVADEILRISIKNYRSGRRYDERGNLIRRTDTVDQDEEQIRARS